MNISLKEKLERNIWITRKCRINASERLLSYARYIEMLNVYYSIFVILLSLISLTEQDQMLSIISLACSIALTIFIIYANAAGYRQRSASLKENYIELQILLDRLAYIDDGDTKAVMEISSQYAELLKSSENHIPIDFYRMKAGEIKTKADGAESNLALSVKEAVSYHGRIIWGFLWRGALMLLPITASLLYFTWRNRT